MNGWIFNRLGKAVALLIPLMQSCGSAPTRIYTVQAVSPTSALRTYTASAVQVENVHVPPPFDRIEVVTSVAPGELKIHDLEHWAAPLSLLVRQALTEDLAARLPPGKVVFPNLSRPQGAIGLRVDVLTFEAGPHDAHLTVSWTGTADNPGFPNRDRTAALTTVGENMTISQAWTTLLSQLSDRMVDDLGVDDGAGSDR